MAYRSEANRIANKANYKDLNLTHYPGNIDTRTNNTNMKGFTNVGEGQIPDYVMAEYVNAALDGVMSLQRALGANPMVPVGTAPANTTSVIENSNVKARIDRIENGLFDERYGGSGWTFTTNRPTLSSHNHDGLNGHPGKINLVQEVEGILKKANIDLAQASGITGGDLRVSKTNSAFISDAVADSLSKKHGGIVEGAVAFKKAVISRTGGDWLASELPALAETTLATDSQATNGRALTKAGTTSGTIFQLTAAERADLLYGKYLLIARIKTNSAIAANLFRFTMGTNIQNLTGNSFTANTYKTVYFLFEQNATTKSQPLLLQKLATSAATTVSLDNVIIEPVHPAILDR